MQTKQMGQAEEGPAACAGRGAYRIIGHHSLVLVQGMECAPPATAEWCGLGERTRCNRWSSMLAVPACGCYISLACCNTASRQGESTPARGCTLGSRLGACRSSWPRSARRLLSLLKAHLSRRLRA